MLSRAQQILLKRAQSQAALDDQEYRDSIAMISGIEDCRSSKDSRLTDGHVDKLLAYFEAIYWKKFDDLQYVQSACKPDAVFRQRGYWASKNQLGNNSRDRYSEANLRPQIEAKERELNALGCGLKYCQTIQNRLRASNSFSLVNYLAALTRTLNAKRKKNNCPF